MDSKFEKTEKIDLKPRLVFWEVTRGCNLRCIHCRASATELSSPLDLPKSVALNLIDQISQYASPILVLSGGEPLYRADIFDLARHATSRGLRVALATNGTLINEEIAEKIRDSGIVRVAISLDGADARTHDAFRGISGSFEAALAGFAQLKRLGMSLQINTTIARHNVHQLRQIFDLTLRIGADALHTFLLVPVGCGVDIAEEQMVNPQEYEDILHWFYDRSQEGQLELKATCAPHYYRIARQRQVEERRRGESNGGGKGKSGNGDFSHAASPLREETSSVGPLAISAPGSVGVTWAPQHTGPTPDPAAGASRTGHPRGRHPHGLNAMTRGCLAGTGVCFISHQGEVFPCGYLPVRAGRLPEQSFQEIWEKSHVFELLRDTDNLKGKCGACEFRNLCLGCRARAYGVTGDFLAEEPFCVYQPGQAGRKAALEAEASAG